MVSEFVEIELNDGGFLHSHLLKIFKNGSMSGGNFCFLFYSNQITKGIFIVVELADISNNSYSIKFRVLKKYIKTLLNEPLKTSKKITNIFIDDLGSDENHNSFDFSYSYGSDIGGTFFRSNIKRCKVYEKNDELQIEDSGYSLLKEIEKTGMFSLLNPQLNQRIYNYIDKMSK